MAADIDFNCRRSILCLVRDARREQRSRVKWNRFRLYLTKIPILRGSR